MTSETPYAGDVMPADAFDALESDPRRFSSTCAPNRSGVSSVSPI